MPFKDKETKKQYQKQYHQKWYSDNKKTQREKQSKRSRETRTWFAEYKATLKCNRCIESHPSCLEFHHVDEKNDLVSTLVANAASKDRIMKEVALCEVLCSNCHRKEHWLDWYLDKNVNTPK